MKEGVDLNKNILSLTSAINKQNSFKRVFLMSLVSGIGSAIGATLVAGAVITIIYRFILSVDNVPIIQKIIPPNYIENIFKSSK